MELSHSQNPTWLPGVNNIKLFSLSLAVGLNKLEHLFLFGIII
jgi:hypothetical protein